MRTSIWVLLFLFAVAVPSYAAVYKCSDPSTKKTVYSDRPCDSDAKKLSITDNAIMDGKAAQADIARRRALDQQEQAARDVRKTEQSDGVARGGSEALAQYQARSSVVRRANMADRFKAEQLVSLAFESQNTDAVSMASREIARMNMADRFRVSFLNALDICKSRLAGRQSCKGLRVPSAHDPDDDVPAGLTSVDGGGAVNHRGEFCPSAGGGYACPSGFVPK